MMKWLPAVLVQKGEQRFERWLNRRIKPTRKITLDQRKIFIFPTTEGFFFALMILAIFLGGVNYESTLVLGLSFSLAAMFIITILHTYRNLSGLVVEASRVESCFAGDDASFAVNISRQGRRTHESIFLSWQSGLKRSCNLVENHEETVLMLLPTQARGWYTPGRLKVYTEFPLGIVRAWSWLDLDVTCLVYPRPIKNNFFQIAAWDPMDGQAGKEVGVDDFEGLKPYVPGDPLKHVHWKSLARSGELHSKVFVTSKQKNHWLNWSMVRAQGLEQGLSCLCYWVLKLSEADHAYGLRLPDETIQPGKGVAHKIHCLSALAKFGLEERAASLAPAVVQDGREIVSGAG
jgi:uncharacterized protein (DUF58 family)